MHYRSEDHPNCLIEDIMGRNSVSTNLEHVVEAYRKRNNNFILPSIYVIEPTNHCNLQCSFCPNSIIDKKGFMSFYLFSRIINQIKDTAKTILLYFRGEPLLHKGIFDMVEYCKNNTKARIILSTNGTMLNSETAIELVYSGLDDIILSLDGQSKQSHEMLRKVANFNQIGENIHNIINLKNKYGRPRITIKIIKTKLNKNEIKSFARHWKEQGCDVKVSWMNTCAGQLPCVKKISGELSPNRKRKRVPCADLWFKMVINYLGDVVLCCHDYIGQIVLGNFNDERVENIWNSPKLHMIRTNHRMGNFTKLEICKHCIEWSFEEEEYEFFEEFASLPVGRP